MDALCAKLTNPLREVRHRALHTLHSKLQCGLLRPEALVALTTLPRNLLALLESTGEGRAQVREALALLEALALHPTTCKSLLALGAPRVLEELDADLMRGGGVAEEVAAVTRALARQQREGPAGASPDASVFSSGRLGPAAAAPPRKSVPTPAVVTEQQRTPPQGWDSLPRRAGESSTTVPRLLADAAASHPASRALSFPPASSPAGTTVPPVAPVDAASLPVLHWMTLPRAPMGTGDWQAVLEATVQLSMNDARVLRGACASVGGSLCHDVPLSGLLRRPALLRHLLSLLRASEISEIGEITSLVIDTLGEILGVAAAAIRRRSDALECSSSPPPLACGASVSAGPTDPVTGSAYSGSPAPHDGNEGCGEEEGEAAWPVWRLAGEVWTMVSPLLRHERALSRCVPLLLRTLPLLYLPPHGASAKQVRDAASLWRGYFDRICDVLRYHRLLITHSAAAAGGSPGGGNESTDASFVRVPSARGVLAAPVALLALAAASTPPAELLRLSAPPALLHLLRSMAQDPWLAICQPHAHRTAVSCMRRVDPMAASTADGASLVELAAECAERLRQIEASDCGAVGGGPGEAGTGCARRGVHSSTAGRPLQALVGGCGFANPSELRRRAALMRRALPALTYFELPGLIRSIVGACASPATRGAASALLLPCLSHPVGAVREATLRHLLSSLLALGETASRGRIADASAAAGPAVGGLRAPLSEGTAAAAVDTTTGGAAGACGAPPDASGLNGDEPTAAAAEEEAAEEGLRWAAAEEASASLLSLLSRRACLQLLVELALGIGGFGGMHCDLGLLSQMRLAEAVVLAVSQQVADRPVSTDGWCASVAPLLPLVQARLPPPLSLAGGDPLPSCAANNRVGGSSARGSEACAATATTSCPGGPAGSSCGPSSRPYAGRASAAATSAAELDSRFGEPGAPCDPDVAATAAIHAHILHSTFVPVLDANSRLCAALRMLLHRDEGLAAQAAAQLASSIAPAPVMGAVPPAPLHGLPPPPAELLLRRRGSVVGEDRDGRGWGGGAFARGSRTAAAAAVATFSTSELRNLEKMTHNASLDAPLRASAAAQLAVLLADPRLLARAFHPQIVEAVVQTAAAVMASLVGVRRPPLVAAEAHTGGQEGREPPPPSDETEEAHSQAAELLASLLHVLAAIAGGCSAARVALLHSSHALHVLRRAAFLAAPAPRAALRLVLARLLFSEDELAAAATTFALPDLSLPADAAASAARDAHAGESAPLHPAVVAAFDLPSGVTPAGKACADEYKRMMPPDAAVARTLACRRLLREVVRAEACAVAPGRMPAGSRERGGAVLPGPAHSGSSDKPGKADESVPPAPLRKEILASLALSDGAAPEGYMPATATSAGADDEACAPGGSDAIGGGSDGTGGGSGWPHMRRAAVERALTLDPALATRRALSRLEGASDHTDCIRALTELHALASSHEVLLGLLPTHVPPPRHPLLAALAEAPPGGLLSRLLLTPPATPEDDAVLEALLRLTSRALAEPQQPAWHFPRQACSFGSQQPPSAPPLFASPADPAPLPGLLLDSLLGSGVSVLERACDEPANSLPRGQLRHVVLRFGVALLSHPNASSIPRLPAALLSGRLMPLLAEQYFGSGAHASISLSADAPPQLPHAPSSVRRAALALLCACANALVPALCATPAAAAECARVEHVHGADLAQDAAKMLASILARLLPCATRLRSSTSHEGVAEQRLGLSALNSLLRLLLPVHAHALQPAGEKGGRVVPWHWIVRLVRDPDAHISAAALRIGAALGGIGRGRAALLPAEGDLLAAAATVAADAASPFVARVAALDTIRLVFCAPAEHPTAGPIAGGIPADGIGAGVGTSEAATAAFGHQSEAEGSNAAVGGPHAPGGGPRRALQTAPPVATWRDMEKHRLAQLACELLDEAAAPPQLVRASASLLRAMLQRWPGRAAAALDYSLAWGHTLRWLSVAHHWAAFVHVQVNAVTASGEAAPTGETCEAGALPGVSRCGRSSNESVSAGRGDTAGSIAARARTVDRGAAAIEGSARRLGVDAVDAHVVRVAMMQAVQWLRDALPQVEAARVAVLRLLWTFAACDGGRRLDHLLRTTPLVSALAQLFAPPLSAVSTAFDPPGGVGGGDAAAGARGSEFHALSLTPPPLGIALQLAALGALQSQPAQQGSRATADAAADETRYAAVQVWHALLEHVPALSPVLLRATLVDSRRGEDDLAGTLPQHWAHAIAGCILGPSPMPLRLETCRLLSCLLASASPEDASTLDIAHERWDTARTAAAGEAAGLPFAGMGWRAGAEEEEEAAESESDDEACKPPAATTAPLAAPTSTAGAALATALLSLDAVAPPAHAVWVLDALRTLLGQSRTAKLMLLHAGFLPVLLSRITDLRGLCPLPSRRHSAGGSSCVHVAISTCPGAAPSELWSGGGGGAAAGRFTGGAVGSTGAVFGGRTERQVDLVDQLLGCVGVLSNLLSGCEEAKLASVSLQLPLLLQRLWALSRGAPALARAMLPLIGNYVAHCPPAKCSLTAYSDSRGRCLISLIVRAVTGVPHPAAPQMDAELWAMHWRVLQALATAAESRTVLLRSNCIGAAPALVRRLLSRGERADEARAAAVVDFMANLAFNSVGCTALLRVPDAFECLLDALGARHHAPTRYAAALALRNVAFSVEGKGAFLAKPRALPALVGCLDGGDLQLAALCSGALWALLCRCERAKVAFRRGGVLARQLSTAERELTFLAMRPPAAPAARAQLQQALRSLDVVAQLLGLDPTRLKA